MSVVRPPGIGAADELQSLMTEAQRLAAAGFRVFPCHAPQADGCSCGTDCASPGKHPHTPSGCKEATCDPRVIEAWWGRWPGANIGVATGSGLIVIDLDGFPAQAYLATLAAEHGGVPVTRAVLTGRDGGRHLWFQADAEDQLRNSSGRLAKGIDTRGEGGYVLVPPSSHASNRRYSWEQPNTPLAPLPSWIRARLMVRTPSGGDLPTAAAPDGLDARRVKAVGDAALSRELGALAAHSNEEGAGRGTALFACAGRLGRIVSAGGLDLASTWQALDAAGQALGLTEQEADRSIKRGFEHGLTQPLELADRPFARANRSKLNGGSSAAQAHPDPAAADAHGEHDVQDSDVQDSWPPLAGVVLPPFPLEALPAEVARFVEAVAVETQTPADVAAVGALGVLSAAALGAAVVDCGNWTEELGLYALAVMSSGDHKSAVLRSVVAPLQKIEREWREAARETVRDRCTSQETLTVRKRKLVQRAGEMEAPQERLAAESELAEVAAELDQIGEPVAPRLLADDATPEALGGLLAKHGRIAILAAEAAFLDNLIGRYDSKGSGNLHLVCQAYNGEPTYVDRRGRDPEQLDRPLLAVFLAIQPHVLRGLVEHPLARDQGLVGRCIFVVPESLVGRRLIDAPPVAEHLRETWERIVRRVSTANPLTEPTQLSSVGSVSDSEIRIATLSLSPSAKKLLDALRAELEPRLAQGGDLQPAASWVARHPGRIARIAGLLHLSEASPAQAISEATMGRALQIGSYLLAHGLAAVTEPDETTRRALTWLSRREEETVTQRDLHRGPLAGRSSADEAEVLIEALVARGALRRADETAERRPGRPSSPRYEINPLLRQVRGGRQ